MNKESLNILYHHRTQGRGAEGVHITSIVNALQAEGHRVKVLSPVGVDPMKAAGNAPVDKSDVKTTGINSLWKFISKNLPNFLFEMAEIFYNIIAMRALEKELKNNSYNMIYERYAFFMFAGAVKAKKYNIPFVLEANEVSGIQNRARPQIFIKTCDIFERFLFKRCVEIHTVSSYLKEMIIKQGVPDNRVHVTPNAIDPNKFNGQEQSIELLSKYHLQDKIVIGFAGWFDEWDRLDLLLEVFVKLKKSYSNLVLLLVGDGAVLTPLRNQIKKYGIENAVVLTGAVSRTEVQDYISLLNIAVITHSNEFGSPVVMFEFMGLKIPIVAPSLMPITDVLEHEQTGLIFDVLDMKSLQSNIEKIINDKSLSDSLANLAFTKLMKDHTWENNVKQILHVLR